MRIEVARHLVQESLALLRINMVCLQCDDDAACRDGQDRKSVIHTETELLPQRINKLAVHFRPLELFRVTIQRDDRRWFRFHRSFGFCCSQLLLLLLLAWWAARRGLGAV